MTGMSRQAVDRASSSDVMQLVCDVSGTSMQVAAVLVLAAGAGDVRAVRRAISDRITAVPRLRQRLIDAPFGAGRPVWIDDAAFALDDHVTGVVCPEPGDEPALLDVAARIVALALPRSKPLWSATLVTGLTGGRSALVVVFHHVLADGIGGLAVLARLVDGPPVPGATSFPEPPPRRRDLFVEAAGSRVRSLGRLPAGVRRLGAAVAELRSGGAGGSVRCSLNRPIGRQRALTVVRADLAAVRTAAHAWGGTVNDVVLAAVTGALRAALADRGEDVDRFVLSVPVSSRRRASATELGNQVGVRPVSLPATGDPGQRLAAVVRITHDHPAAARGASAALLGPVFRVLARLGVFGWFVNRQHLVNSFVSNLRGPEHRLTFLGTPVLDVIPVSALSGNVTVAFAVLSYAGTLNITVIADPDNCPDLPRLARALQGELRVLTVAGAAALVSD